MLSLRTWGWPREAAGRYRVARLAIAERDCAWELVATLREDLADAEQEAAGWRRRAEALYDAAPADLRDGVLGCLTTIENLPVVGDQ